MAEPRVEEVSGVAVATCAAVPILDGDGPTLLTALQGAGVVAEVRM